GKLQPVTPVPTTAASIFTNPASQKTFISSIDLHNTTTSTRTVTLYYVPNSSGSLGTQDTGNQIYSVNLSANDTILLEPRFPYVLDELNDAIFAVGSDTGVNILCRGSKDI